MANPRKITIDISKQDTQSCTLSVDIKENTLKSLIESLKETKEVANKYLTKLVEEDKSQSNTNCRKIDELVSSGSDEDIAESVTKKLKSDNVNVSKEESA